MRKKLPLILFLLLAFTAAGLGIFYHFSTKTKFNSTYVNGNTAGNLYNAGLICESNGTVFFANPSDEYKLYSMNSDGTNLTKLSDDIASFINADEHYVYYVRNNPRVDTAFSFLQINTNSLCRIRRDGKGQILVLDSEPCLYASLVGNYIYYLHYNKETATSLYKVKIDGSEQQQVSPLPYYTCSTAGSYIYYNGLEDDHYIRQLDTASGSETILSQANAWMPSVIDDTVYFMDCDNNYRLVRADFPDSDRIFLSGDRIDCYNVSGDYAYFQRNSKTSPAFCRVRTDGSEYEVIAKGIYTDINTDSSYVYFRDFNSGITYRADMTDISSVEIFNPGTVADK